MKTLKIKLLAIMMIIAVALSGCTYIHSASKITSDGLVTTTATAGYEREAIYSFVKDMTAEQGSTISLEEFDSQMVSEGMEIKEINGKDYYVATEKQTCTLKEFEKSMHSEEGTIAYVTTDTLYYEVTDDYVNSMTGDMTEDYEDMLSEEDKAEMEALLKESIFIMSFEFPSAIVSTNGTVASDNPNMVTFDLLNLDNSILFATTKSGVTKESVKKLIDELNEVKAPKIKKLKANKVKGKAKKATALLKFKKVKAAKRYQIEYGRKKNFSDAKVKYTKKTTLTLKKLAKGKKYFVRVRACKKNYAGYEVYSKWTKAKVKTKK